MKIFNPIIKKYKEITGNTISIPNYQRKYQWTPDLARQLFIDLKDKFETLSGINKEADDYLNYLIPSYEGKMFYLGQIVKTNMDGASQIVDGQQRLTTLFLIFKAISDYSIDEELGPSDPFYEIFSSYLSPKLEPSKEDEDVVRFIFSRKSQKEIQKNKTSEVKEMNKKAHVKNFKAIYSEIKTWKPNYNQLINLMQFIQEEVKFLVVEINDIEDAINFFEIMNSKSIALSPSDLIKNYVLKSAGDPELAAKSWNDMIETLGENSDNLSKFIRFVYIARIGSTSNKKLFQNVKNLPSEHDSFISDLKKYLEPYREFMGYRDGGNREVDSLTNAITRIGARESLTPIILEIIRINEDKKKIDLLEDLVGFSYKYFFNFGFKANAYAPKVTEICRNIAAGNTKNVLKPLFSVMKEQIAEGESLTDKIEYAIDEFKFSDDEKSKALKISKAIFPIMYTKVWRKIDSNEMNVEFKLYQWDIEHIYPKTPSEDSSWIEISENTIWNIGNLIPISDKKNRTAKNADFKLKYLYYKGQKDANGKDAKDLNESLLFKVFFDDFVPEKFNENSTWDEQAIENRTKTLFDAIDNQDVLFLKKVNDKYK